MSRAEQVCQTGGEAVMGEFVDRRSKSITRATVEKAYEKLNVFGAPYIWALFSGLSLVEGKEVRE